MSICCCLVRSYRVTCNRLLSAEPPLGFSKKLLPGPKKIVFHLISTAILDIACTFGYVNALSNFPRSPFQ